MKYHFNWVITNVNLCIEVYKIKFFYQFHNNTFAFC